MWPKKIKATNLLFPSLDPARRDGGFGFYDSAVSLGPPSFTFWSAQADPAPRLDGEDMMPDPDL